LIFATEARLAALALVAVLAKLTQDDRDEQVDQQVPAMLGRGGCEGDQRILCEGVRGDQRRGSALI
jgi:hypothetical protein